MAYNRKNFLTRVLEIQELYKEKNKLGITNVKIHQDYIFPRYHVSRATFYEYLVIPAKRDLKKIDEAEKQQLKLFGNE